MLQTVVSNSYITTVTFFLCCGKSIVFILQGSMRAAVTYYNRKNTWCIAHYDCNWAYKNLLGQDHKLLSAVYTYITDTCVR
jgi:hypothetical protein